MSTMMTATWPTWPLITTGDLSTWDVMTSLSPGGNQTSDSSSGIAPSTQAACDAYQFAISVILTGGLCLWGWLGNTLSVLVMWPERQTSTTSFTLMFLAFVDNAVLFTRFMMRTIPAFCSFTAVCPGVLDVYKVEMRLFGWALVSTCQMATIYTTVLVTTIRYVAVCYPHRAASFTSMKHVRLSCVIIIAISIIYNTPRFFATKLVEADGVRQAVSSEMAKKWPYSILYKQITYYFVFYVIPLLALIKMTYHLIQTLKEAQRKRQQMSKKSQTKVEITTTLVAVIVVFFVCQMFTPVRRTLAEIIPDSDCPSFMFYFSEFVSTAIVFNSACNFVLYCVFGKRFRRHLLALLRRRRQVAPDDTESLANTVSQYPAAGPTVGTVSAHVAASHNEATGKSG